MWAYPVVLLAVGQPAALFQHRHEVERHDPMALSHNTSLLVILTVGNHLHVISPDNVHKEPGQLEGTGRGLMPLETRSGHLALGGQVGHIELDLQMANPSPEALVLTDDGSDLVLGERDVDGISHGSVLFLLSLRDVFASSGIKEGDIQTM
jgi:hypothetical protein